MKKFAVLFIQTFMITSMVMVPVGVLAQTPPPSQVGPGATAARPDGVEGNLAAAFKKIANVLIFLVGAVAVLVLIAGGFTYVVSAGDPGRIKRAKDTILYGVVGVVVAILAYAIINFVVGALA